MLLTCPNCRSGLEVPDGTDGHVRCPSCATVFPAEAGAAAATPVELPPPPPPPPPAFEVVDDTPPPVAKPRAAPPPRRDRYDDEEEDDRRRRRPRDEDDDERPRRRRRDDRDDEDEDDEPPPRPKRVRRDWDDETVPLAQRRAEKAAFARGMWGSRLLQYSFAFYLIAMALIVIFFVRFSIGGLMPSLIVAAGAFGLLNWILGAVGVGMCVAGPKSPGHFGYGIAAAVATGVHLIFLLVMVSKAELPAAYRSDPEGMSGLTKWGNVPTALDRVTLYMTLAVYADRLLLPGVDPVLPIITGLVEMVRAVLIMMLLSGLARAAGDEELSQKCTRAAGAVSFGPGAMALVLLAVIALIIESNAESTTFARVILTVTLMGIYVMLAAVMLPPLAAARDTAEACESPYMSRDERYV